MDPFNGYRFDANTTLPIRALSPNHGAELSREYFKLILERAIRYGYNHIHVANNGVQNDLDQFIHYAAYPGLEEVIGKDRAYVEDRVELFRWFTGQARAAGIETYVWHHEVNFPPELATLHPDGFHGGQMHDFPGDRARPTPKLDSPVLWDFIEHRFKEAYDALPDLTGIILTMQESDIPIYHLSEDQAERTRLARRMYDHVNAIHKRLDRRWILRTFAWREWEYAAVFDALEGFDPDVFVEMKVVPMDWHMAYPYNGLITTLHNRRKIVEMDIGGNFWGECELPAVNVRRYAEQVRFAAEHGCEGAVLRVDRSGGHTFGKPMEAHAAVLGDLLNDLNTDIVESERKWLAKTYGPALIDRVKQIADLGWEITKRTFFVGDSFFFHHHYWNAIRSHCNLFVAERDLLFEPGDLSFRHETDLAELYVARAERLLAEIADETGEVVPDDLPDTMHFQPISELTPLAELARQVRNLRTFLEFFSGLKEVIYSLKCQVYERTADARARTHRLIDQLEPIVQKHPYVTVGQPTHIEDLRYVADNMAERAFVDATHYSIGQSFAGRSYAVPYPKPLHAALTVNPDEQNILVVFMGTHMCREAVAEITVNDRTFELRRGTMSWFWGQDGFKRGEIELPPDLCASGAIDVVLSARTVEQAPLVSEIRTEVEYDGYKPRKDQ